MLEEDKGGLVVFVGGLYHGTTNQDLQEYFAQFGHILGCQIQVWKHKSSKCRGFACVTTGDQQTYDLILSQSHKLNGRLIDCKPHIQDKEALNEYSRNLIDRKIFVSGLPKTVDDEKLKRAFESFGPVDVCYIIKHHKDYRSKGFGFVSFRNKQDRDRAVTSDSMFIDGKAISSVQYNSKYYNKSETTIQVKDATNSSTNEGMYSLFSKNGTSKIQASVNKSENQIDIKVQDPSDGKLSLTVEQAAGGSKGLRFGVLRPPPKYILKKVQTNFQIHIEPSYTNHQNFVLYTVSECDD